MEKPLATVSFLGLASASVNISKVTEDDSGATVVYNSRLGLYVLISLSIYSYSDSPFGRLVDEEFGKVMEGYYE